MRNETKRYKEGTVIIEIQNFRFYKFKTVLDDLILKQSLFFFHNKRNKNHLIIFEKE